MSASAFLQSQRTVQRTTALLLVGSLVLVMLGVLAAPAHASHFRYRDISWRQVAGNEVELTMKLADRRSFHGDLEVGDPSPSSAWRWATARSPTLRAR